jgi:hypothetical protein
MMMDVFQLGANISPSQIFTLFLSPLNGKIWIAFNIEVRLFLKDVIWIALRQSETLTNITKCC